MHPIRRYSLWFRRFLYFSLVIALVTGFGIIRPAAAQSTVQPSSPGFAYTGRTGITETTDQIMVRQRQEDLLPRPATRVITDSGPDFSGKGNNPASAGLAQGPSAVSAPAAALAPQAIGLSFDGPSSPTPCATPPDTMGAVGPTQFITTLNCNFVSYNKLTGAADGALNASPNIFFNSVRGGFGTSDPHIRYDRISGRWFIVMINVGLPSSVLLAVSSGASITGASSWTFFSFPDTITPNRTNCLSDYPTPGIDANAIYIGVNQYCGASLNSLTYLTSDAFVVQKSSVEGAGPIKVTAFPNLYDPIAKVGPFTPQGIDNPDPAATEGYFIAVDGGSWGLFQLRRVSNPGADPASATPPTISGNVSITTPLQSSPLTQPHLGNTGGLNGQIDGSDGRLLGAYFRDGSLWTSLDSGVNSSCASAASDDRDAVFWYQITGIPTGSTPALNQAGSVCDTSTTATPAYYSYGTIMVNGQGHVVVGYTIAGAANFTTPGFSGRLNSDPLSTLEGVNAIVPGSHPYNPTWDTGASGSRRWGDFSYVSLDPCDDMTLWTIQEYASANNTYGERIAQLKAPPPATPATATSVAAGLSSVNVTVTGTSSSGSGFYDTPTILTDPCRTRLTASTSGGVTVNSVTFTDATHITLNVSTVGASAGAKDVTITNPDGQSLTGAGILNVTAAALTGTTTSLNSSFNPSVYGQSVSFTVVVAPVSGTVVPTGTVTFSVDSVPLPLAVLNSVGAVTVSAPPLAVGTHTVSATYSGDPTYSSSSGTLSGGQVVSKANTVLGLSSSLNPSTYGQSVTFTAAVTAAAPGKGTPTGTVTFTVDGSSVGPATLNSSGMATFTTSTLAAGSHTVSASYTGDANFLTSNGTLSGGQTVSQANTTLGLTSSLNPSTYGQSVTFTAAVTAEAPGSGTPSGTVAISVDGLVAQITALNSVGSALFSTSTLSAGLHTISAAYSGDASFTASSGALAGSLTVTKASAQITLTSSVNPIVKGQPVTFTATVTSSPGLIIDGQATITINGVPSTAALSGMGMVSELTSALPQGKNTISATYNGSANFSPSGPFVLIETVNTDLFLPMIFK